jgi:iron(III)-salmochelin esterase
MLRRIALAAALVALAACSRHQPPPGRGGDLEVGRRAALTRSVASVVASAVALPSIGLRGAAPAGSPGTAPSAQAMTTEAQELTWVYDKTTVGPMQVVVSIPRRASADIKLPVLVTMHGRGEAFKGPARGARGWVDDYWMPRAIDRISHPPLTPADLLRLADPIRLQRLNEALAQKPYRGLIVVCPYTPDILAGDRPFSAARGLSEFLVDVLLPRVYEETPALGTRASTGIDGVSLGGRAALLVGLERPTAFGVVAGLQPAFDSADAPELGRRAEAARRANPSLVLRLLTSDGDYFLQPTQAIAREWRRLGVMHELLVVPGPHNYEFNRGPGAFEMLTFHDRALRGDPPI